MAALLPGRDPRPPSRQGRLVHVPASLRGLFKKRGPGWRLRFYSTVPWLST